MADLRSIVLDLCRRAGIADRADVTGLAGKVPGMVLANRMTVRAAIEALQHACRFDVVESDGRVVFRARGSRPVATLTGADLVPDRDGSLLRVDRRQETELPARVDVLYAAPSAAHQTSTQSATRVAGAARGAVSVELPLALADRVARRIAERLLTEAWVERDVHSFQLGAEHARLEPGDVVELDARGRVQRLRLTATEMSAGVVQVTAVPDDGLAEESDSDAAVPAIRQTRLRRAAPSVLFAMDVPLLREGDDGAGWYVAASWDATVAGRTWRGAQVMRSFDGANYESLLTLGAPAPWGVCEGVLPSGPTTHWDEHASLRVRMRNGDLESRTATSVLQGANAALVGGEVVQFRQAALQADGSYVLSGLLRGRRGTEHAVDGHGPGETLLLLGTAWMRRVDASLDGVGAQVQLKAVTLGSHAEDAEVQSFTRSAAALRPWSVAHPRGTRNAASGDWTITWVRRSRLGPAWIDGADVALGEESERYELDVLDGSGARLRTLAVGAPVAVYDAAMQLQDFGAPQSGLRLRIHQISATVGRGVGREVTL